MDKIMNLVQIIKNSSNTVFFGGAGVSTESGLKDIRSKDRLYHETYKYPPEASWRFSVRPREVSEALPWCPELFHRRTEAAFDRPVQCPGLYGDKSRRSGPFVLPGKYRQRQRIPKWDIAETVRG